MSIPRWQRPSLVPLFPTADRSFQKIGNIHSDGRGWAVGRAWHTVPTLVVGHVGLLGDLADPQHVERAYVDAYGAPLVGNAFFVIDDDRDCCESLRQWHVVLH